MLRFIVVLGNYVEPAVGFYFSCRFEQNVPVHFRLENELIICQIDYWKLDRWTLAIMDSVSNFNFSQCCLICWFIILFIFKNFICLLICFRIDGVLWHVITNWFHQWLLGLHCMICVVFIIFVSHYKHYHFKCKSVHFIKRIKIEL